MLLYDTNNEGNLIRVLNSYIKYPMLLNTFAMNTLLDPNLTQVARLSHTEKNFFVSSLVRSHGVNKMKKTVGDFKQKINHH
jgi:hypothetical protein